MTGLERDKRVFAYTSIISLFLLYAYLRLWPIFRAFFLSFTNRSLYRTGFDFVGFDNYIKLFTRDEDFVISLSNTLVFAFSTAVISLLLAFVIATVMYRRRVFGTGLVQSLIFLPVVISVLPGAIIWKWIYDAQFGILNFVLRSFGARPIAWLTDADYSMFSIIVFVVWKWLGYYMVIFLVGLGNIPRDFIESATIDGAKESQLVTRIIVPLMAPIIFFASVMATIKGFTIFAEVYVMTSGSQGAPGNIVKVLVYDIYERAFLYGRLGEANAEAVVLFVILLIITLIQARIRKMGARVR